MKKLLSAQMEQFPILKTRKLPLFETVRLLDRTHVTNLRSSRKFIQCKLQRINILKNNLKI